MKATLIEALVSTTDALATCRKRGNDEWADRHEARLSVLKGMLPSGSGIDSGTEVIQIDEDRITLKCSFHHMNETGYYTAWTGHTITVKPTLVGLKLTISGRDKDQIKDHLYEVYHTCLTQEVEI